MLKGVFALKETALDTFINIELKKKNEERRRKKSARRDETRIKVEMF